MTPSQFLSPTDCLKNLKSNKANDFLKIEEDLYGKSAAATMNSD